MGNKEIYILPFSNLLTIFLEKYQFDLTALDTREFIEDILSIARYKLANLNGDIDVNNILSTLKRMKMDMSPEFIHEVIYVVDKTASMILEKLFIENIHNKLFYVIDLTPNTMSLNSYNDHIHNGEIIK